MNGLVLSLFPGIGLLDMAFEEEGFCVVRGPDLLWGGDIHRFHPPAGRFEGVIGGPPCQAFSSLGNISAAKGLKRPNLIPEFERVVGEAQPRWFLMENVRPAPLPSVAGYLVRWRLLNQRWVEGATPQNRVRRFSFGTRQGSAFAPRLAAFEPIDRAQAVTAAHGGERRTYSSKVSGGRIVRYSVEKALALQGLPADHLAEAPLTKQGALQAIANGVPLPMGRAVARAVREATRANI